MPRGPNEGDSHNFDVTISLKYFDYLRFLARDKGLGATANAVAAYLLTQKIESMIHEGYHKIDIPRP
jgi:hypothetical protein